MKIAIYVTPHGYGHLTRTLEVFRRLRSKAARGGLPLELHFRAPFRLPLVAEGLGGEPTSIEGIALDGGLIQHDALHVDLEASLKMLRRAFGPVGQRAVEDEARWLERQRITLAFVDIPPRAFDACALAGVPAFGLANFGWDYIWGSLATLESEFGKFAELASRCYGQCHCLFRTVMNAGTEAFPRVESVPLIARSSSLDREEIRERLGLELERPMVLLAFGGEGLRPSVPDSRLHRDFQFVVAPPMTDPGAPFRYLTHEACLEAGLRYPDLIRASDLVMTKPGYGTVGECLANRTAMVISPREAFAESEQVMAFVNRHVPHMLLSSNDLASGKWEHALRSLWQQRPFRFSEERTDGAEKVAAMLYTRLVV